MNRPIIVKILRHAYSGVPDGELSVVDSHRFSCSSDPSQNIIRTEATVFQMNVYFYLRSANLQKILGVLLGRRCENHGTRSKSLGTERSQESLTKRPSIGKRALFHSESEAGPPYVKRRQYQ
jgi:hypothetical protein